MNLKMRKIIGWGVASVFKLAGIRQRRLATYSQPGTVLSMFGHNPQPGVLEGLLKWFTDKGFHFVSTDELLSRRVDDSKWRPKTAWLTFDDGWNGFEERLLPILERYDVPATIFVAPNETERGAIWTNSVMGLVEGWHKWYDLSAEERYAEVDKVLARNAKRGRQLADKDELCRLVQHPLITLENHTYTHLSCSHRPTGEVLEEIQRTQYVLKEWTGREPRLVCYPFGHCTKETDSVVMSCGLLPVSSFPGCMNLQGIGRFRNMFHDAMGLQENIGRVLQAWPKVTVKSI